MLTSALMLRRPRCRMKFVSKDDHSIYCVCMHAHAQSKSTHGSDTVVECDDSRYGRTLVKAVEQYSSYLLKISGQNHILYLFAVIYRLQHENGIVAAIVA